MSASDIATAGHEVKSRLYAAAQQLFENETNLNVCWGWPLNNRDRFDVMSFRDIRTQQEPATISTNRSRDEDIYVTILVESFRAGEADDDREPEEAVFGYIRTLERHIRVNDPSLGGLAQSCFLDNLETLGATDADDPGVGRLIMANVEFKARVRITG